MYVYVLNGHEVLDAYLDMACCKTWSGVFFGVEFGVNFGVIIGVDFKFDIAHI